MSLILRTVVVALWLVPLRYLLPFMALALYSGPETDDYCLSAHDLSTALAHIHQYYMSVSGRLPALALMTTPSVIAGKLDMDFIVLYPLANLGMICALIVAMVISAWRLLHSDWTVNVLFGLVLSAIVIGLCSDLREFIYWLTGAACYLVPTLGSALVVATLAGAVARREPLSLGTFLALTLTCLISSASNEFTGLFLAGTVVISYGAKHRSLGRTCAQIGMHGLLLCIIVVGFAVVALAPGSRARMEQIPRSGNISLAFDTMVAYVPDYLRFLGTLEPVPWAALSAVCFGCVASQAAAQDRRLTLLFAAALTTMTMVWVCVTYFIGGYATGEPIAMRARNEVWAIVQIVAYFAVVLATGAIVRDRLPRPALPILAGAGVAVVLSLSTTPASARLRETWPEFSIFWRETLERHFLLKTTSSADVVVPRRSVTPSLLMEEELTSRPDRLPNDCVAALYGRRTVVISP